MVTFLQFVCTELLGQPYRVDKRGAFWVCPFCGDMDAFHTRPIDRRWPTGHKKFKCFNRDCGAWGDAWDLIRYKIDKHRTLADAKNARGGTPESQKFKDKIKRQWEKNPGHHIERVLLERAGIATPVTTFRLHDKGALEGNGLAQTLEATGGDIYSRRKQGSPRAQYGTQYDAVVDSLSDAERWFLLDDCTLLRRKAKQLGIALNGEDIGRLMNRLAQS